MPSVKAACASCTTDGPRRVASATDERACSASGSGTPSSCRWLRYVDWSRLPSTAMPSAPPSSRARSLVAEPTPCFATGSASVIAVVAGVIASPMPAPSGSRPASSSQYELSASSVEMVSSPATMSSRPSRQARSAPAWAVRRGAAIRADGIIASAMGTRLSADTNGLWPRTSCRYCMSRKTKPKNAKNCKVIESVPAANARWRNSRGSSSGAGCRSSQAMKAPSSASPVAMPTRVCALAQPASGASMIE